MPVTCLQKKREILADITKCGKVIWKGIIWLSKCKTRTYIYILKRKENSKYLKFTNL